MRAGKAEPGPKGREAYRWFVTITTRWMDNDAYQHVNNVVYYSFFDTAVNRLLIELGLLDIAHGKLIGLVAETQCRFHATIAFPDEVHAGVRVGRLGTSSVRYEIGLFRDGEHVVSADGYFVHVYVDRDTKRPTPLPAEWRECLARFAA